jgi:hypothetical protein
VDPRQLLRRWYGGCYAAGGLVHRVAFVLDARGLPVTALPRAALDHEHATLFIPEESDEALQILVAPHPIPESDPAVDRFLIYHGRSEGLVWTRLEVLGARLGAKVFDPEEVAAANPWTGVEPALCRRLNSDRALLARAVRTDDPSVRSVGVDPWGMDVRLRWEVLRVPWPEPREGVDAGRAADAVDACIRTLAGS